MKRFYRAATVSLSEAGHEVLLDGRSIRTPARNGLALPTAALAQAVADEWERQGDKVDPRTMPLTGLANAAIDRVAPDRGSYAQGIAAYGESDLLYYRAEGPAALVERQASAWDPILAWARRRFDIDFEVIAGVIHRPQPERTVAQLARAVCARDPFALAALHALVTIGGSLVVALALAEGEIGLDLAWAAATLDEAWQAEQWGEDPLALAPLEGRRRDFEAAARFLTLLG